VAYVSWNGEADEPEADEQERESEPEPGPEPEPEVARVIDAPVPWTAPIARMI
jgi:hypothetical protein